MGVKKIHPDKNRDLLIVLLKEDSYNTALYKMLSELTNEKVCYVLLRERYEDVKKEFKEKNISLENFCFIDVLSSYYEKQKNLPHVNFLSNTNTENILKAVDQSINKKKSKTVIFDNITALNHYLQSEEIQLLTNKLKTKYTNVEKILIVEKGGQLIKGEIDNLLKDIKLYADRILEF